MPERPSSGRPKSSRRRRWEVKSKESFDTSLAVELGSPDISSLNTYSNERGNGTQKPRPTSSKKKPGNPFYEDSLNPFNEDALNPFYEENSLHSNNNKNDFVSAKLSALLDESNYSLGSLPGLRESEENLIKSELENCDPSAPPLSPTERKRTPMKKTSVKVSPINSGVNIINSKITEQLKQLSEDITEGKQGKNESVVPALSVSGLLIGPSSSSTFNGNVSTIYCERLNNFVLTNESQISKHLNEPLRDANKKETRKSHAIFVQTGFRTFSVLCQGILAGFTLAHCITIFILLDAVDILIQKDAFEHTFFVIIYFLSSVCLISAFDRCDVAGEGVFSDRGIRIPWAPLFYLLSFILSLVMIRAEDFITHFDAYSGEWKKEELITWWKWMCLSRTVFAVLASAVTVTDPHTDALNTKLSELAED